jgi:hypothetical protein
MSKGEGSSWGENAPERHTSDQATIIKRAPPIWRIVETLSLMFPRIENKLFIFNLTVQEFPYL